MVHTVLVAAHAASGLVAFSAGCIAIRHRSAFAVYLWSLVCLVVFLAAVVAVDWSGLGTPSRALFTALTALGGCMIWHAVQGRRVLSDRSTGRTQPSARYLDRLGFTLVALFDSFAIIAVLTAGGPGWLAAVVGVTGAAGGHATIKLLKARLVVEPGPSG